MKKTLQSEKVKVFCDITGKEKTERNYLGASLRFSLMFFDKKQAEEIRKHYKDYGYPNKSCAEEGINADCYSDNYIDIDLYEKVALEVFNFLKSKYPKQINKLIKDSLQEGCDTPVLSGWK